MFKRNLGNRFTSQSVKFLLFLSLKAIGVTERRVSCKLTHADFPHFWKYDLNG
jgi:hypothetical protein